MTDDTRRVVDRAGVVHLFEARTKGGMCAACGRLLAIDEPVWVERLEVAVAGWRVGAYRAPVGRECASAAAVRETAGREPGRCVGCGRGVYYRQGGSGRRPEWASCSRRCAARAAMVRFKGKNP